jgi:hypothetical protein
VFFNAVILGSKGLVLGNDGSVAFLIHRKTYLFFSASLYALPSSLVKIMGHIAHHAKWRGCTELHSSHTSYANSWQPWYCISLLSFLECKLLTCISVCRKYKAKFSALHHCVSLRLIDDYVRAIVSVVLLHKATLKRQIVYVSSFSKFDIRSTVPHDTIPHKACYRYTKPSKL